MHNKNVFARFDKKKKSQSIKDVIFQGLFFGLGKHIRTHTTKSHFYWCQPPSLKKKCEWTEVNVFKILEKLNISIIL